MSSLTFTQRLGEWSGVLLDDPCAYCGTKSDVIDHIKPRSAGGENTWENAVGSCRGCNGSKGPRTLLAFLGYPLSGVRERVAEAELERSLWMGVGR